METVKNRYVILDIIRSIAILLVIVVHAGELLYYEYGTVGFQDLTQSEQFEFLHFFTLGRLGVPLFLFLTGYLMLDRAYLEERFFKNRFIPLYVTSVLGISMLVVYDVIVHGVSFEWDIFIEQLLMLRELPGVQTWYIPVILAIYLFLPFASRGVQGIDPRNLLLSLVVAVKYLFFIREINILLVSTETALYYPYIDFGFITSFGVYLLFGWVIKQGVLDKIPSLVLIIFGFLSYLGLIQLQKYSFTVDMNYLVWYDSGLLLVTSICLFTLLLRLPNVLPGSRLFRLISACSFGIFWIHTMVQDQLYSLLLGFDTKLGRTLLLILGNFVISFVIVLIYKKLKNILREGVNN